MSKKRKDPDAPPVLTGNAAYIAQLRAGNPVTFGEKGNSMVPRIKSRQKCTYAPVTRHEDLHVGDVVFCSVGRWTLSHLLTAMRQLKDGVWQYQISNNHGHVNGWTSLERIYGKVIVIHPADGRKTKRAGLNEQSGSSEKVDF
jgi:hypothetical protein